MDRKYLQGCWLLTALVLMLAANAYSYNGRLPPAWLYVAVVVVGVPYVLYQLWRKWSHRKDA
jgi:hypothetical protein